MTDSYADVAIVIPVFNEAHTILKVLESIEQQTRYPREVLVVEGGSEDETVSVIEGYIRQRKRPYEIRLIRLEGRAYPGRARNEGIRRTTCPLVACTDAGGRVASRWLEDLIEPLRHSETDLVIGNREPDARTFFERCTFFVHIGVLKRDNIPFQGSLSIAFRRGFWESIGGYPEQLYPCEDKYFLTMALNKKAKIHLSEGGIVYWKPRSNLPPFFLQYLRYGRGDGEAAFYPNRHLVRLAAYGGSALLWTIEDHFFARVALLSLVGYWSWMTVKGWRQLRDVRVWLVLPLLWIAKDMAQIIGYSLGATRRFFSPDLKALAKEKRRG